MLRSLTFLALIVSWLVPSALADVVLVDREKQVFFILWESQPTVLSVKSCDALPVATDAVARTCEGELLRKIQSPAFVQGLQSEFSIRKEHRQPGSLQLAAQSAERIKATLEHSEVLKPEKFQAELKNLEVLKSRLLQIAKIQAALANQKTVLRVDSASKVLVEKAAFRAINRLQLGVMPARDGGVFLRRGNGKNSYWVSPSFALWSPTLGAPSLSMAVARCENSKGRLASRADYDEFISQMNVKSAESKKINWFFDPYSSLFTGNTFSTSTSRNVPERVRLSDEQDRFVKAESTENHPGGYFHCIFPVAERPAWEEVLLDK